MDLRLLTPYTPVSQLFCNQFHQGPLYANWRPRGSEDWLLIYTDGGAGQFSTRFGSFVTRRGEVVLYTPGDMQDYRTSSTVGYWDLMWVHFRPRPTWEAWLQWPRHENGLRYLDLEGDENQDSFRAALGRMRDLACRSLPVALDLASNALEEALLWANIAASNTGETLRDERVRQAADYLSTHLREAVRLENLAAHCGLSVSRLAHLFKEQTGHTPQQFQERQRMRHACQLLHLTGLSIAEVALEVGYSDPFYFSNRFRRSMGQSPLQFRRQRDGKLDEKKKVSF